MFAYYADHNYEGAIGYFNDSLRLFDERAVNDEFKPAQAWARHFLAVLKKNWPLRVEADGTSLQQAQQLLAEAENYLTMESGQFLTALTHAEVLSYIPGRESAAKTKIDRIIELLEERKENGKANSIQLSLLPRAHLLHGNIAHMRGDRAAACASFTQTCKVAEKN